MATGSPGNVRKREEGEGKVVGEGERLSFVDYVNKHVPLRKPIDPESPTDLFEVISEGLVLW